ncbi:hypothetical protein CN093_11495 [Sinorhizobium meliloti]|uniref:hypothetical protein n=1 Tax=Rhizobium meliloti TaxID=382 RepID=UPI000FD2A902|nr:hypothetical protein [Sinorhizobium meliloti]RVO40452.1 hypothetical protein CN093_11495 [Sinorhizobium meliloti]
MSSHPAVKAAPTFSVDIHMAGDIAAAGLFIQRYAIENGMCVTLMPQSFIYTGGREEGFRVGFINYPRFPTTHLPHIQDAAYRLALALLEELGQHSFCITDPERTVWYSRREADPAAQSREMGQ